MKVDLPEPAMPMTMMELALGISGSRPRCVDALGGVAGAAAGALDPEAADDAISLLRMGTGMVMVSMVCRMLQMLQCAVQERIKSAEDGHENVTKKLKNGQPTRKWSNFQSQNDVSEQLVTRSTRAN